jgi:hypothetical protein
MQKNMADRTNHTILGTVENLIQTVLLSKAMGTQEVHEGMDTQTSTVQERERAQRGKFCSDNLQGSKESILQTVTQAQEMSHK